VTDYPLYDVVNTCRQCGVEYPAKAFVPQGTEPRFGLCPKHLAEDEKHMAQLKQPPVKHGRSKADPEPEDRRHRQTRWEPD
jgi:hypothetical protein